MEKTFCLLPLKIIKRKQYQEASIPNIFIPAAPRLCKVLLVYLQATEEVPRRHEFERLLPGGRDAVLLWVDLGGVEPPLEEQQHAVHDSHDEVRRAAERPHSGDVRRLDGLEERGGDGWRRMERRRTCEAFNSCLKIHECNMNKFCVHTKKLSHGT